MSRGAGQGTEQMSQDSVRLLRLLDEHRSQISEITRKRGADNIRVNVVCPFANSDGVRGWSQAFPEIYRGVLKGNPMHRIGDTHDDIGATVAFLLSDDASYLNAQTIHIDGGMGSFR